MIFDAIRSNFFGYDLIIVLLAICNGAIYWHTKNKLKQFREAIYRPSDLAARHKNEELLERITLEDLTKIKKARAEANRLYSFFSNAIAIFPLLGLLGTVIALINVAGADAGFDATQHSFMMSLTSTFWGMISAIIYKFFDAGISPEVELLNSDAKRVITTQED